MSKKIRDIKPLGEAVLVEVILQKEVGGIHLPEESQKQAQKGSLAGKVLRVGPKVRNLEGGETVMFYKHLYTAYDSKTVRLYEGETGEPTGLLIREEDILSILEE